jgi:hypothetical protein
MAYPGNLLTRTHFSDQRSKLDRLQDQNDERVSEIMSKMEALFDALDECEVEASKILADMVDRDNRRAMDQVRRHIMDAMNIVEDLR